MQPKQLKIYVRGIEGAADMVHELRAGDTLRVESCENGVLVVHREETLVNAGADPDAEVATLLDEADAAHAGADDPVEAGETTKRKRARK